tara:strand:+ start:8883 stop:9410 length:528 start_codon:yes stop_codon:yes gene_type:complete
MALTNASLTQGSSVTNTNNVVTGTGVFDDLMESVTAHLEAQFQLGRITGTDFATVYLGAIQSALQASVTYALGQEKTNAEVALLTQKQTTEFGQTLVTGNTTPNANSILGKQTTLYGEQAKGFKWNADQKYLKTLLDAWAINISTAGVASTNVTALNATGTGNINTQITNAEPTG